jgi:protocatechuate 3,4-dioxygenase beta subunit
MNSRTFLGLLLIAVVGGLLVLFRGEDPAPPADLTEPATDSSSAGVAEAPAPDMESLEEPTARIDAEGASDRILVPGLATSSGPEQPEEAPLPRVFFGRVLNTSGFGVQDARVWVNHRSGGFSFAALSGRHSDEDAAVTDAEGRFRLDAPKRQDLRVNVRAGGFAPFTKDGLPAPKDGDLGDFVLQPGVILVGRVLSDLGQPLEGARLRVEPRQSSGMTIVMASLGEGPVDATTGADGRFVLDELAPGTYLVEVHHPLHPNREVTGQCEQPGQQPQELTIHMDPGGSASGLVHGWDSAQESEYEIQARPMSEDFIERAKGLRRGKITNRNARTGEFTVSGLRMGKPYEFLVERKDSNSFMREGLTPVIARAGDHGIVLELHSRAGLEFRVINAKTGAIVENFTASAGRYLLEQLKDGDGKVLRHHPEGRASFTEVESDRGRATLEIASAGFASYRVDDLHLSPGSMQNLGDIRLKPVPVLHVKVVDDVTGDPVAKAKVQLLEPPGPQQQGAVRTRMTFETNRKSTLTDEEGRVELTTSPGRPMSLRASRSGYATLNLPERTYGAEELEVRLAVGGQVKVTVRDPSGAPLPNARISRRSPSDRFGGNHGTVRADDQGIHTFEHLSPGSHSFRIEVARGSSGIMVFSGFDDESAGADWTRVEVGANTIHELDLVGAANGNLHGRLTVRGRPLADASLQLSPWSERDDPMAGMRSIGGTQEKTNSTGAYELTDRSAGEYELTVNHPDRWMEAKLRVTIQEGDNEFNFDLSDTILEGRVLDTAGNGIAGAELRPVVSGPGGGTRRVMMIATSMPGGGGGGVIRIGGPHSSTVSDEDGSFRLHGVRPDVDLTLKVTSDGYQPADMEIEKLDPDEVRTGVDVKLEVGSTLTVHVFDADGQPGRFGTVILKRLSGGEDGKGAGGNRFGSFQNGTVELQGMAPGHWTLVTTMYSMPTAGGEMPEPEVDTREIEIVEGDPLDIEVRF